MAGRRTPAIQLVACGPDNQHETAKEFRASQPRSSESIANADARLEEVGDRLTDSV